jgi:hypothetical protein
MHCCQGPHHRVGRYLSVIAVVALAVGPPGATGVAPAGGNHTEPRLPPAPDHGIQRPTFDRLWAGAPSAPQATQTATQPPTVVDHTFAEPPAAAAQWTAGEHDEVPTTGPDTAVVPSAATPTSTAWLRDAHLTIFAVQPSTVVHGSPSQTRHYVRPNGTVRGVADYRVVPPANHTIRHQPGAPAPGETVLVRTVHQWALASHRLGAVGLLADGRRVATTPGSHRPAVSYTDLPPKTTTLTLRTTVSVTLTHTIRRQYRSATRVCAPATEPDAAPDCWIE